MPDVTEAQAKEILEAANFSDEKTLANVHEIRGTEAAVSVAATVIGGTASPGAAWAAAYVYAAAGQDAAVLAKLLDSSSPTVRLLGARGLVLRGDRRGFAALTALLSEESEIDGSHTSSPVWVGAAKSLVRATGHAELGPPFDADAEVIAACQARWKTWLATNSGRLAFDAQLGEWDVA